MEKTLLVLGAGASKDIYPYFPTGIELFHLINYHFTCDKKVPKVRIDEGIYLSDVINKIVEKYAASNSEILIEKLDNELKALKAILWKQVLCTEYKLFRNRKVEVKSIDSFLEINLKNESQFREYIQFVVAYLLLGYESGYFKYRKRKLENTWVFKYFDNLKEKHTTKDICDNIRIVTFNYDRTLEFLIQECGNKLFNNGDWWPNENIHHAYNHLGKLDSVKFESDNKDGTIVKTAAENLEFINAIGKPITFDIDVFARVHFLGFGFYPNNLKRLEPLIKSASLGTTGECGQLPKNTDNMKLKIGGKTCTEYIENLFKEPSKTTQCPPKL